MKSMQNKTGQGAPGLQKVKFGKNQQLNQPQKSTVKATNKAMTLAR